MYGWCILDRLRELVEKKLIFSIAPRKGIKLQMSTNITAVSKFDLSKVSIGAPKVSTNGTGSKTAYLSYNVSGQSLTLQTPSLPTPFGMNVYDKQGPPKYSLDLALRGWGGENPKVKAFYDVMTKLDEYMIDHATKNSKLWFKQDMKREVVEAFYTPSVKFGRDKEGNPTPYPPNVKLQLRKKRDSDLFETAIYDESSATDSNARPITGVPMEDLLVKRADVTCLMQCTGVWFAGGKFGLSWKALQIRLDKVPSGIRGYGFVQDDDEAEAEAEASESAPVSSFQNVEDDDEDEEVVSPPVPAKTTTTVKKVLKKALPKV